MGYIKSKNQSLVFPNRTKFASNKKDFLLTEKTDHNSAGIGYPRYYMDSKAFKLEARRSLKFSVMLVSTEVGYYPQLSVFKRMKHGQFSEVEPLESTQDLLNVYKMQGCDTYIIEVG